MWLLLAYGSLVLILWLSINYQSGHHEDEIPASMLPNSPPELPITHLKILTRTIRKNLYEKLNEFLNLFKHENLHFLISLFIQFLEWIYGIRGNYWDFARAFKAALIFYFVIIPLPAAFLPPVGGLQVEPSVQLMAATVILILINAVGDMFSVNCSVKIIRTALDMPKKNGSVGGKVIEPPNTSSAKMVLFAEIKFYCTLILDMAVAIGFLILVLMASSILYGVQTGEFDLSTDANTLMLMLDSAQNFDRLFGAFYWFANDPDGVLGQPGIPGMLVFSLTTFFPTLVVGLSAFIWLLVLPIRILLTKDIGRFPTLIASQLCVFIICLGFSVTTSIDVRAAYALITTT